MNTYFIIGVVVAALATLASSVDPEPSSRESRLFGGLGGGGWGWKKRPIETVFITYPKKGWGWKPEGWKGGHGIHHYHAGGHGGGGGGGGGWGWQPEKVIPKHIHLPGGHFESPGWGWEGWGEQQSYGHGGGWGWGQGGGGGGGYGGGKKGHKKGGHGGGGYGGGGHGGHQQGWGWQDPWQGGYERSDLLTSAEIAARNLEVDSSFEVEPLQAYPDGAPFPYSPEYASTYSSGEDY